MADNRESFATLQDAATGAAFVLEKRVEGDVAAAKNGLIGFSFKDSSGNVVLPALTAAGEIVVTQDAGVNRYCRGETAAGSAVEVTITGGTITLIANALYRGLSGIVSCRRAAYFNIVWNDNGTPTVLADMMIDSGQYSVPFNLPDLAFTAGAVGTQELLIKASNIGTGTGALSALRGTISISEIV